VCGSHGISNAYYCTECTRLEKDRDGCPKIVNLGASRTDAHYERQKLGYLVVFDLLAIGSLIFPSFLYIDSRRASVL
jgi:hypothetical protein